MFEAWYLRSENVTEQEETLRLALRNLSDEQRSLFYKQYATQIKDPDTYAALNWFFVSGLHNFYLKEWLAGILDLMLMLIGCILLFFIMPLGVALLILVSVIELPALFRSQIIVADYNNKLGWRLLKPLQNMP
ncbi:TM2 domain-containing protein [Marinomonas atlantica]|uniref:hypothetical protein n=1 Tax=Marinomonas atlantica TaxID=1806668 RepID=UPI00083456F7|nr:hypothetical protein [Marinomonas atlantica]MCO4784569.1 hypothetical protein [Marinomonas atlantica]